jgi:hypothetical protein
VKTWLLRNGNQPGNPNASPRCGALTRHCKSTQPHETIGTCQGPGMKMPNGEYGRCRMHGGAAAIANWKHGRYAAQTEVERLEIAALLAQVSETMVQLGAQTSEQAKKAGIGQNGFQEADLLNDAEGEFPVSVREVCGV